jgi:hypothetical protein
VDGLRAASVRTGDASAFERLELSVTPPAGLPDSDTVKRYADLGIDRLILLPAAATRDDLLRYVDSASSLLAAG